MKIASRYRPFSHKPGAASFIPGTHCAVRAYPTALLITNEEGKESKIKWALTGLVHDFTVLQDLEKKRVLIYGRAQEGYFSYALYAAQSSHLVLKLERASMGSLKGVFYPSQAEIILQPKEEFILCALTTTVLQGSLERISFGNHKAQDWEKIKERSNPIEYFPFWFAAGQQAARQQVAQQDIEYSVGTLRYVQQCRTLLEQGEQELFLKQLQELFKVGFEDLFLPRLYDTDYLGVESLKRDEGESRRPFGLLRDGYQLIRAMLLQEQGEEVKILPHLPAMFHAGRALDLRLKQALCTMEWSKKLLKKLIITSFAPQTLHLSFQKPIKSFRLKNSRSIQGKEFSSGEPIHLEAGVYVLDRFMK